MSSATSNLRRPAPNFSSRSSPSATRQPASSSPPTCPSASGRASSPTRDSARQSSTASPSVPTSSRPAPTPGGSRPAWRGPGSQRKARNDACRHDLAQERPSRKPQDAWKQVDETPDTLRNSAVAPIYEVEEVAGWNRVAVASPAEGGAKSAYRGGASSAYRTYGLLA